MIKKTKGVPQRSTKAIKHRRATRMLASNKVANISNKYGVYLAQQESREIDNALFTLSQIQPAVIQVEKTVKPLHTHILAQK